MNFIRVSIGNNEYLMHSRYVLTKLLFLSLLIQLILNGTLCTEAYGQISILGIHRVAFHVLNERLFPRHSLLELGFVFMVVNNKRDN